MKEELTKEEILQAFFTITKEELELAVGIINTSRRLGLTDTVPKKILPRPVIRDGNDKLIADHTPRDFFLKLQEEIFETIEKAMFIDGDEYMAEEIADIITVCISYLNANGYDEKARAELFAKVNAKNEKRGYFEVK